MALITLSGIDEQTDIEFLTKTFEKCRFEVEFAILLSAKPEGRNRYPTLDWIRKTVHNNTLNLAVHICGTDARKNALAGDYNDILGSRNVGRVQVNGKVSPDELKTFMNRLPYTLIITQDCPYNEDLANLPHDPRMRRNREILIDGSGGRGVERSDWNLPNHLHTFFNKIGFAGGLGPDNLAEALPKIHGNKLKYKPWVDMESKLRDENDWFSIEKAQKCIDIVYSYHGISL